MILKLINTIISHPKNNTLIIGESFSGKSWLAEAYLNYHSAKKKIKVTNNFYFFSDDGCFLLPEFRNKWIVDISRDRDYLTKINNSKLVIFDDIDSISHDSATKIFPLLFNLLDNPFGEIILLSQGGFSLFDEIPFTRFFDNIIVGKLHESSLKYCHLNNFPSIHLSSSSANNLESRQFLRYTRENESFVLKDNFKLTKEDLNQRDRVVACFA